jgi:hypothetical protein
VELNKIYYVFLEKFDKGAENFMRNLLEYLFFTIKDIITVDATALDGMYK